VARVFISHATPDHKIAIRIRTWLREDNHQTFLAQDVEDGTQVGDDWKRLLYDELGRAEALVCVVTQAFVDSPWCAAEVGIIDWSGKTILPVLAQANVEHRLLRGIQFADLATDPGLAQAAIRERLRRLDANSGGTDPADGKPGVSPYPGLRYFDVNMSGVFFGRRDETRRLAEMLNIPGVQSRTPFLVVVGPSGCGKSSLVRAGLMARLDSDQDWLVIPPVEPGDSPVTALAARLTDTGRRMGFGWTLPGVREALGRGRGLRGLLEELLAAGQGRTPTKALIVLDQCEELFTRAETADRDMLCGILAAAVGKGDGPLRVVATMRSEFVDQALALPALAEVRIGTYTLRTLDRDVLPRVVLGPARAAGITVDDDLLARLVAETPTGEALPLLAFTLSQLAAGVERGGALSAARYDELGGVAGTLSHQADAALAEAAAATGRRKRDVLAGLLRLVKIDKEDRATRRRVDYVGLSHDLRREADEFIARRLLVIESEDSRVWLDVAHERLFTDWQPLRRVIREEKANLALRDSVEDAANGWNEAGRRDDDLWGRRRMSFASASLASADLTGNARDFLRAGRRRARRLRARVLASLTTLLVVTTTVAVVMSLLERSANDQRTRARDAQQTASARAAVNLALALREADPRTALQLGAAAATLRTDDPWTTASLLQLLAATPTMQTLGGFRGSVNSVQYAPNGMTLATGDDTGAVTLWDYSDRSRPPRLLRYLHGHTAPVHSVAFSRSGGLLASGSEDGTVRIWNVRDPGQAVLLALLSGHRERVDGLAFDPAGNILVTGSNDGTAIIWDITQPSSPHRLYILENPLRPVVGRASVDGLAFSRDGRTLASSGNDGTVRIWAVADPEHPRKLAELLHNDIGGVWALATSPRADMLVTAGDKGVARLWDMHTPAHPRPVGPELRATRRR
jgi:TIR domain/WD domain, G-beta repeat/AAA ATPase domain